MNAEILRLVDTIHRDKDIEKEIIFQGIEAALLSAGKKKLGEESLARVEIDRVTGETRAFDEQDQEVPIEDLGRIAAMSGKQVLFQRIREAERDKVFDEYEEKLGKLVTGVVQRIEGPNLIINLGKVEGILPRGEQAPGEKFRVGERIKLMVKDVRKNANRVRITLSRASPLLVKALFELEVPEIADKVIEIVDLVREPGYRTKIAVTTYDHNVDCVGACVGVRGSRIKNIVDELFGEKIDIVRWNESIEVLIMNALKPAEISSMDLDYEAKKAAVYVKPDQQSLAIGKRGQNVRLASKLSKWDLDIVTVSDEDIEKLRKEEPPESLDFPSGGSPRAPAEKGAPAEPEKESPAEPEEGGPSESGETPVEAGPVGPGASSAPEPSAAPEEASDDESGEGESSESVASQEESSTAESAPVGLAEEEPGPEATEQPVPDREDASSEDVMTDDAQRPEDGR